MSIFNQIKVKKPSTNTFNLSHDYKTTFNFGELIPVLNMEVLPGDVVTIGSESLLRLAPILAPVMHRARVYVHHFFVPNRILWDGWEDFITGASANGSYPAAPYVGGIGFDAANEKSLSSYLGLPSNYESGQGLSLPLVSALPFAAYSKIYNEYYRAQDIIPEIETQCIDGNNNGRFTNALRYRAYGHDYFTSALPWAQKGAAVQIPVTGNGTGTVVASPGFGAFRNTGGGPIPSGPQGLDALGTGSGEAKVRVGGNDAYYDPQGTLSVGDIDVQGGTINELRRAWSLQRWLEKNARAGTRYVESLLAHWGVRSSDARLQRPEYLGGHLAPIVFSEVLQTSESNQTPQGNMAGHGISVGENKAYRYRCEEHGFIMSIMSVIPDTAYMQGVERKWNRFDPLDYAWPDFAHIGEQEILNKEIYYYTNGLDPNGTFGYGPRYSEYKYLPSQVTGEMRTTYDFWHLTRKWTAPPSLSQAFIECRPNDVQRIFAVQDGTSNQIIAHLYHKIYCNRRLPMFGTPI